MLRFLVGRLIGAVVVLWIIVTLSFFLMRFAPGSPFDADRKLPAAVEANKWITYGMGTELTSPVSGVVKSRANVEEGAEYDEGVQLCVITGDDGKDHVISMERGGQLVTLICKPGAQVQRGDRVAVIPKSLFSQYTTALGNYAQLDFGTTISSDGTRRVSENLALGFPISLELGLYAMVIALILGVGAGLVAGLKANTATDYSVMSFAMIGISIPTIVSGPLLILAFIHTSGWFPFGGWGQVGPWPAVLAAVMCLVAAVAMPKVRAWMIGLGIAFFGTFLFYNGWHFPESWLHKLLGVAGGGALLAVAFVSEKMKRDMLFVVGSAALAGFFLWAGWTQTGDPGHLAVGVGAVIAGVLAIVFRPVRALLGLIAVLFVLVFCFWSGWAAVERKILPALTLGFVYMASFARLTRGGMLEVISSDYIRTARAKGLSERDVVLKHAFKGAILPTVSFMGPALARIVTGSIVVERVFSIPGLADYFVVPALNRDYPMVLGVVVVYSALLIVMNLLVDIAYTVLDPRVSYD